MPKTKYAKDHNHHIITIRRLAMLTDIDPTRLHNIITEKTPFTLTKDECTTLSNAMYEHIKPIFSKLGFKMPKPKRVRS